MQKLVSFILRNAPRPLRLRTQIPTSSHMPGPSREHSPGYCLSEQPLPWARRTLNQLWTWMASSFPIQIFIKGNFFVQFVTLCHRMMFLLLTGPTHKPFWTFSPRQRESKSTKAATFLDSHFQMCDPATTSPASCPFHPAALFYPWARYPSASTWYRQPQDPGL